MQEQAVFREKYNFVKFEVLRIKSLLGGGERKRQRGRIVMMFRYGRLSERFWVNLKYMRLNR